MFISSDRQLKLLWGKCCTPWKINWPYSIPHDVWYVGQSGCYADRNETVETNFSRLTLQCIESRFHWSPHRIIYVGLFIHTQLQWRVSWTDVEMRVWMNRLYAIVLLTFVLIRKLVKYSLLVKGSILVDSANTCNYKPSYVTEIHNLITDIHCTEYPWCDFGNSNT